MHDSAKGGAWPLLVGEVICLLNCVNERDLCQLLDACLVKSFCRLSAAVEFFTGFGCVQRGQHLSAAERHEAFTYWDYVATNYIETRAQSRSVMLLYVLGCTRTTLIQPTSFCLKREGQLSRKRQPGPKGLGNLMSLSRDGD